MKKFRAWDKKDKIFIDGIYIDNEGRIYEDAEKKYNTPNTEIVSCNDIEIMQFTGLTDRNGKEVFEGDCDDEGNCVILCEDCMGWQFAYKWNDVEYCHNCDGNYMFMDYISNFEVTGNIYETKNQYK